MPSRVGLSSGFAAILLLVGCRDDFNAGGSSTGSESTGSSTTGTGTTTDATSSDTTSDTSTTTETGPPDTSAEGESSESTTGGGADLKECLTAGFSFPDGPPSPGEILRIGFTSPDGLAGVAFQVDAFVQTEIELVQPESPFLWEADIPGAEVPPAMATFRFLDAFDGETGNVVAECVATY